MECRWRAKEPPEGPPHSKAGSSASFAGLPGRRHGSPRLPFGLLIPSQEPRDHHHRTNSHNGRDNLSQQRVIELYGDRVPGKRPKDAQTEDLKGLSPAGDNRAGDPPAQTGELLFNVEEVD